jgi:anti-sigma B factor antagonist
MQAGLEVDESHAPVVVVRLSGEVDVFSAPRLREKIIELVTEGRRLIVVDLDAVQFLDSTGLGVLVGGLKRVRSHDGDMNLVCNEPRVLRVFELTRLGGVFAVHHTVTDAVTTLAGRA